MRGHIERHYRSACTTLSRVFFSPPVSCHPSLAGTAQRDVLHISVEAALAAMVVYAQDETPLGDGTIQINAERQHVSDH